MIRSRSTSTEPPMCCGSLPRCSSGVAVAASLSRPLRKDSTGRSSARHTPRRVVLEGDWLAVHLHDTGTRAGDFLGAGGDGAHVATDEFNMYRVVDGLIVELEGTADNAGYPNGRAMSETAARAGR